MPAKKKATAFEESSDSVRGWPYKVYGSGLVKVGTAGSGRFKSFTFRLTSYEEYSSPAACVEHELDTRKLPAQTADGSEADGADGSDGKAEQPEREQPAGSRSGDALYDVLCVLPSRRRAVTRRHLPGGGRYKKIIPLSPRP